jgi:hypothetical protein
MYPMHSPRQPRERPSVYVHVRFWRPRKREQRSMRSNQAVKKELPPRFGVYPYVVAETRHCEETEVQIW